MKLDRSRPFGEIFGGNGGAKYEQDGKLFSANGELFGQTSPRPLKALDEEPAEEEHTKVRRGGRRKTPVE